MGALCSCLLITGPLVSASNPDDIYDDDNHRQGPRQPAVTEETPISDVDVDVPRVDAQDATGYIASCESPPQSDGRKMGPKKLKRPQHRHLLQKYVMMSPSSTDIDEAEASNICPMANDEAASTTIVELNPMGQSVRPFMLTKSEERESRVNAEAIPQDFDERLEQKDAEIKKLRMEKQCLKAENERLKAQLSSQQKVLSSQQHQ